ncbi:Death-associated inhibitor of apoptosis 1 [Blattella germanica]|nr:Death-associated inhibitor of apoptosis 1 [Blattella germanica]
MAPDGTKASMSAPNTVNNILKTEDTRPKPTTDTVDSPPEAATSSSHGMGPTPQQPQSSNNKNWLGLDMKRESDRRRTYESWTVLFMDPHRLSAAGFYFTGRSDVVRCPFCGVEVGDWEEGDDPFRDHQRWSPSCGFVRGMAVGNIPINPHGQPETSFEPNRSRDVCGPFLEIRPNAIPERGMSNGVHLPHMSPEELRKHGINQSRAPDHPAYNTYEARLHSYDSWPKSLKQKPDKLSEAGFYYTGGLKDWEENDDPWVEHALWFPKCLHVVLIKGTKFIDDVHLSKASKPPVKDIPEPASTCASSSSAASTSTASPSTEQESKSEVKVLDDARICLICFQEERGVLFLPCGHLVACVKCAPSLSTCAVCRQPFSGTVRAFLS